MKTLQDRLVWARDRAGKTQQDVADFIGVKQASYSELETGKTQRSKYVAEIAHFLGVNAYWLATGKGRPTDAPSGQVNAIFYQLEKEDQETLVRIAEGLAASRSHAKDQE